jgi:REP element-mobilizing transposase RayT
MSDAHEEFSDSHVPLGYLITFRTYGSWLHGDERRSVDRSHNRYGDPLIPANERWRKHNRESMKRLPVLLDARKREAVEAGIRETCRIRKWNLWGVNVRSNHIHAVVTAPCLPAHVTNAFKANATRKLRDAGLCRADEKPWVPGGSKKYLWTERELNNAIAYVMYDQGEPLA